MSAQIERWIGTARIVVVSMTAGIVAVLGSMTVIDLRWNSVPRFLTVLAALFGVIALPLGWRLHRRLGARGPQVDPEARGAALLRATVAALGVTEASAMLGIVVWGLSGEPFALLGVAGHLLLAGAIWPSIERWDSIGETRV